MEFLIINLTVLCPTERVDTHREKTKICSAGELNVEVGGFANRIFFFVALSTS